MSIHNIYSALLNWEEFVDYNSLRFSRHPNGSLDRYEQASPSFGSQIHTVQQDGISFRHFLISEVAGKLRWEDVGLMSVVVRVRIMTDDDGEGS